MYKEIHTKKQRKLFRLRRSKIKTIAVAFGLVGFLIIGYVAFSIFNSKRFPTVKIGGVDLQKNAFLKFFYKTSDASGKEVVVTAEKVIEETKDNFIFEKVTSNFMLSNDETGTITSNFGKVVRGNRSVCEFRDNVVMTTKSGMLLRTDIAVFDSEKSIISGDSRINITKEETKLSADKYSFNTEKNILTLTQNAKAYNKNRDVTADELTIALDNDNDDSVKQLIASGNAFLMSADYDLSAKDSLIYEQNKIKATKDVELIYKKDGKNLNVKADQMDAFLNDKSDIKEIFADGNVIIKTNDSVVKANHAVYKDSNKVIASGNVVISKEQGDIFGEEAELDINTENVVVKKSSGIVEANSGNANNKRKNKGQS